MLTIELSPAQRECAQMIEQALPDANILTLYSAAGAGKSTVLRHLQHRLQAGLIGMPEFFAASRDVHPLALENAFMQLVVDQLERHEVVLLDDFDLFVDLLHSHAYPRSGFLEGVCEALTAYVLAAGRRLVLTVRMDVPQAIARRAYAMEIPDFSAGDYEFFGFCFLPRRMASALDYHQIFRFAENLSVHDLKRTCAHAARRESIDTEGFIDILRGHQLASNVDLAEVQPVDLHDLRGLDDVIESLEAGIIVPLENDALAQRLQLRPKRGVLLAGPPGTGKTTIGRALAHRLQSKFFLIDGTVIAESFDFYARVQKTFRAAEENAPAVVFIDDSDVIFESGEFGFYRFLLTQLDGLESKTAGKVCVMLTAMNVASLPPALVRSGRIDLWLETRLPDAVARAEIIRRYLHDLPEELAGPDLDQLVAQTEELTGADLKAMVEDAKARYAYDQVQARPPRPITAYYLAAVEAVRANKRRYEEADTQMREDLRHGRPRLHGPLDDFSF